MSDAIKPPRRPRCVPKSFVWNPRAGLNGRFVSLDTDTTFTRDGTMLNADGSRSIFDDVDQ